MVAMLKLVDIGLIWQDVEGRSAEMSGGHVEARCPDLPLK